MQHDLMLNQTFRQQQRYKQHSTLRLSPSFFYRRMVVPIYIISNSFLNVVHKEMPI